MPGVLDIKRATVYRGETRVFEELSLDIAVGEHTAILGPNGAGKSTLLKLLSRELSPVPREDGYVRLFGREQWDVWDLRARLGIVSHDLHHRYSDEVRGTDVVLSGYYASVGTYDHQRFTPAQRHRADHVMDELGVTSHKDRMFAELSAGEQRRFLLGRALVHDPGVLILDEPTGGLDLNACFRYLEIVRRLIRDGKTIILVTHHIHEIPPEVSRIVLLKAGRIVGDGDKRTVLTGDNLADLFETPVTLVRANGYYQAMPGRSR